MKTITYVEELDNTGEKVFDQSPTATRENYTSQSNKSSSNYAGMIASIAGLMIAVTVLCGVFGGLFKTSYAVDIEGTPGTTYSASCSTSQGGKYSSKQSVSYRGYVPDTINLRGYGISCSIKKTSPSGTISAKLRNGKQVIGYGETDADGNIRLYR